MIAFKRNPSLSSQSAFSNTATELCLRRTFQTKFRNFPAKTSEGDSLLMDLGGVRKNVPSALHAPPSKWARLVEKHWDFPTNAKETLSNFMLFHLFFYFDSSLTWSELQTVQGFLFDGVKFYYSAAQNASLHCDVKSGHNTNPVSAAQKHE